MPSPGASPERRGRRGKYRDNSARAAAADARALAWEILQQVEQGAFADALLGHRLGASRLAERDHALVTRLVYGTLAWQGYLDHIIAAFSRRPPRDLDLPVRSLLRLALFQMCLLTRIPDFAAVDTAVQLAKRFRGGSAVSFVNAVLRRAAVGWQDVRFPSIEDDPIGHLAARLSHPPWLVERWVAQYGINETAALLHANNEPAPTVLRANRRRIEPAVLVTRLREAGCAAEPTSYSPCGIRIERGGGPERLPGYEEGLFSLQGEASQLVGFLLAPRPGERVLDACAAPGGKATHLAELMDDRGEIVALDTNAPGAERIERMARRLGLSIVRAKVADAVTSPDPHGGEPATYDAVLVDAPCSGFGTLRQHPEVKWRRTANDVEALARLQGQLLHAAAPRVRPGGTLVYATCTLGTAENEDQIAAFLRDHAEFETGNPQPLLPEGARDLIGGDGFLRTFPHRHGLDGFFAARLKRRAEHGIVPP
jgi:16S rRNA (cytosine967-C5)-methyltransferase